MLKKSDITDIDHLNNFASYTYLKNLKNVYNENINKLSTSENQKNKYLQLLISRINNAMKDAGLKELKKGEEGNADYNQEIPYGDQYRQLIENLQQIFRSAIKNYNLYREKLANGKLDGKKTLLYKRVAKGIEKSLRELQPLLNALIFNENESLEKSKKFIKDKVPHISKVKEKHVKKWIKPKKKINKFNPLDNDSGWAGFKKYFSRTLNPMMASLPGKITDKEHRLGTQAEYYKSTPGINPIFEACVIANKPETNVNDIKEKEQGKGKEEELDAKLNDKCVFLYINNLPLPKRKKWEFGLKPKFLKPRHHLEIPLSHELHLLSSRQPHVDVITLPAENKFFDLSNELEKTKRPKKHPKTNNENIVKENENIVKEMIAMLISPEMGIENNFFMSMESRKKLFFNGEELDYAELLEQFSACFNEMLGIEISFELDRNADFFINPVGGGTLEQRILSHIIIKNGDISNCTKNDLQAVFFHFMKYKLPNFLQEKLQPQKTNMTCFDGIDRGGIASVYYNFITKLKANQFDYKNKEDIDAEIHKAAIFVKGRPIKEQQIKKIWNALDHYISNKNNKNPPESLTEWVKSNVPKYSKKYKSWDYAKHRLLDELTRYRDELSNRKSEYNGIFHCIQAKGKSKTVKLAVANKILDLLNKNFYYKKSTLIHSINNFITKESGDLELENIITALTDGKLSKIFNEFIGKIEKIKKRKESNENLGIGNNQMI